MKTYLVFTGHLANQEKAGQYQQASAKIMESYGAILPPDLYRVVSSIEGDESPGFLIKMEFPNRERAESAFSDPEYKKLVPIREKAFSSVSMFVVEAPDKP